jgi:hypothetical protein
VFLITVTECLHFVLRFRVETLQSNIFLQCIGLQNASYFQYKSFTRNAFSAVPPSQDRVKTVQMSQKPLVDVNHVNFMLTSILISATTVAVVLREPMNNRKSNEKYVRYRLIEVQSHNYMITVSLLHI